MLRATSSSRIAFAFGRTVSFQLPRGIGTITTWYGAILGGRISPPSSPCVMITPPIMRVDTPHDVVQTCCTDLSRAWNLMS